MKGDGVEIDLPENPLPYIVDWLMEIGPTASNGMGVAPLEWREIQSWQDLRGFELNPWEARTLRRLSGDFCDQMHKAKEPNCPAPFVGQADNADAVTKQFERMFRMMAAGKKASERKGKR